MTVKINITKPDGQKVSFDPDIGIDVTPTVGVKIVNSNVKPYIFELNAREALNGDIMIFDHNDIDIVLMQEKNKIVAFAKEMITDNVYGAESRLFEFLRKKRNYRLRFNSRWKCLRIYGSEHFRIKKV